MLLTSTLAINCSTVVNYFAHKPCKGPDALAVCRAHRGLPVLFLLLQYSVLFTVESLSFLYLHLYVLGDDALIRGSFGKFLAWRHNSTMR